MKVPIQFCRQIFSNRRLFNDRNVVASYSTIGSYKSAELNIKPTTPVESNEKNYVRSVLSNCRECILYEPWKKLNVRDLIPHLILHTPSYLTPATAGASNNSPSRHLFDDELVRKLSKLAQIGITPDPNVASQLESQCFKEYKAWPVEKQLLVLELWHHVPASIESKFIWPARDELLTQFHNLSHDHALQTLYYAAYLRQGMPSTLQQMVQKRFEKDINSMTLEVMSVWCLAMFRNQAAVTNRKLIEEIYEKLLQNNLEKFHVIGLTSVLKLIRYSSTNHHATLMMKLQEKLCWHVQHSDLMLLSQIAFVGFHLKIHNPKLLELIVQRFAANIDKMRFKDLERICFVIAMFDYKSSAATALLQEISQHLLNVEKYSFLDQVIQCIDNLHCCGVYKPKLIAWALDRQTISAAYSETGDSDRRELLSIDMFAEINLAATYRGPRLSDRKCAAIACKRGEGTSANWSQLQQIEDILRASSRHCVVARALPHFFIPDVLLIIDTAQNKSIDFISKIPQPGKPIRASDLTMGNPQAKAIAIVVATGSQYLFGLKEYTGFFKRKLQQLDILGYRAIVISSKDWTTMNVGKRKLYLEEMLSKHGH